MSDTAVATDVVMPSLTDGMESGTVIAWLVEEGAPVAAGDELLEVETDKATATVAAEASGALQIVVAVGETVEVGRVIARLGGAGAEAPAAPAASVASPADGEAEPAAAAASTANDPAAPEADGAAAPETNGDAASPPGAASSSGAASPGAAPAPAAASSPGATPPPAAASSPPPDERSDVRASPVARRIARQHDVALATLSGSGPGGRIVRADVERAAGLPPAAPVESSVSDGERPKATTRRPDPAPGRKGVVRIEELTRAQAVVAKRMAQSKAEAPEFVIGVDVDMEAAVALRAQLKELAGDAKPPSFNDFVVKACALALREYPRANGSYADGRFELYEHVNVGVAVAAADALVVPTIFGADRMSLGEIGRESRRLAAAVRDQKVTPAELSGGTFTVSNLGMFGISEFIAVINPPQAAILSVGEMKRTPVEHAGKVVLRHVLKARLTCDHRILYGADAAGFLRRVKELLQAPLAMSL